MATQGITYNQQESIARFPFTTLEGLYQALQMLAEQRADVARGEIYVKDGNQNYIGCLTLQRNELTDGSYTIDAILTTGEADAL